MHINTLIHWFISTQRIDLQRYTVWCGFITKQHNCFPCVYTSDFKVFVCVFFFLGIYVFQSPLILLNAELCATYPLKSLFLHTLIHMQCCFEAKSSCSVPHSLHPSFPLLFFFFTHHVFFFYFLHPVSSVIRLISLTLSSLLSLFFMCLFSSSVGRLLIEFSSQMTMERVQKENPNVTEGGRYTPPDCRPRWKVCRCIYLCISQHLRKNVYYRQL